MIESEQKCTRFQKNSDMAKPPILDFNKPNYLEFTVVYEMWSQYEHTIVFLNICIALLLCNIYIILLVVIKMLNREQEKTRKSSYQ